ncbi:MAG: DNA mismatch repair endonuclease MutL, partial [Thermodesulfobacteriota bacterium]
MDKIKIMPELLSSKIAAGEVVERPASVVKELMENAIDAGATSIEVHVNEGGRRMIRVVDNGCGMSRADATLCATRHATSKIKTDADLDAITTMGFRGEALSSIAAVSKFILKTRQSEDTAGTSIIIIGGSTPKIKDEGSAVGTSIEINDLFYNVPARKKFLRTAGTEFGRITDIFKKLALSHPEIAFKLIHGSSKVIESPSGTLKDRISNIFGRPILKELIEIECPKRGGFSIEGFIAAPSLSYATAKGLFIYINKRPIKDMGLTKAIITGYSGLIERGRYPFAVLYLDMPATDVDVNVHPAKSEIRLKDPAQVFNLIRDTVSKAVSRGSTSVAV